MLVKLQDNLLVNSDSIDAVEIRTVGQKKQLIVYVGGKTFSATIKPEELLAQLQKLGIDNQDQFVRM